jgi:hypothetical protein
LDKAVDLGVEILDANNDSTFVREEDVQKLISAGVVIVGKDLGHEMESINAPVP